MLLFDHMELQPLDFLLDERTRVAAAAARLAAAGLVHGTAGNISLRAGDHVAMTPTGCVLGALRAEDVTVVDLEGRTVLDGGLAPTSEIALHLGIHLRPDPPVAIIHTHAPVATALGCVVDELPCVHYEMVALGGPVRVAPYFTFGTPELAAAVLAALEGRTAAILANHGTVAIGHDLDAAVAATETLEWSAELYWRAAQLGTPRALDADARQAVIDAVIARGYGTTRPATNDEGQS